MLIGEAAIYLNVSVKTLRRWEQRGLITPTRNPQNQRLYRLEDLKQLKHRKHQPLPEIKPKATRLYSISAAADILRVSVKTIRRWDASGKIQSTRNARNQRLFTYQSIQSAKHQRDLEIYGSPQVPTIPPAPISPNIRSPSPVPQRPAYLTALIFLIPLLLIGFSILNQPTNSSNYQ